VKNRSYSGLRSWFPRFWTTALLFITVILSNGAFAAELGSVPDASFSAPVSGGDDSFVSSMSPNGRYVLFSSTANNLAKRTNGLPYLLPRPSAVNVFLRDRTLGTTVLVSADPADTAAANFDSAPMAISTNGQYALFESGAGNLVAGENNGITNTDIFVRDVTSKVTALVTIATNGASGNGVSSYSTMTPDGRYVAFSSSANNLVVGDTNGIADVFVRDMQLGTTKLVSVRSTGTNSLIVLAGMLPGSLLPAITPDGRYISFMSTATNLVSGLATRGELYLSDLNNNTTVCVSSNAHQYIAGNLICYNNKLSDDGQIVGFQASTSNTAATVMNGVILRHHVQTGLDDLVASNGVIPFNYDRASTLDMTPDGRFMVFVGATNGGAGVFVWDGQSGTTVLASADTNGAAPAKLDCDFPAISTDGRYVVFVSDATTLTATSVGSGYHFYRRDLQAGITELVDAGTNGSAPSRNLMVGNCPMSANGRFVAFDCADSDLVTNDNNNASDVFVRDFNSEATELVSAHQPGMASQTTVRGYFNSGGSISADGRYLVYASSGGGLVNNYTNVYREIIIRDLLNQSNFLVSVDPAGNGDANGDSGEPVISADGHYVAFSSYASNLASNDTNAGSDVFIRDLQAPATALANVNANGTGSGSAGALSPSISSDGRYVLFFNKASANVRDRVGATNYVLAGSVTAASMTPDGRYVAFFGTPTGASLGLYVWDSQSHARVYTNLVSSVSRLNISSNGQWIAYNNSSGVQLIDRIAKTSKSVSSADLSSRIGLKFSLDGNSLVYATRFQNSIDDTNLTLDVYVYDVAGGTNFLVSRNFYSGDSPNGTADSPDISADGRYIVYSSFATDIVSPDGNGLRDNFLYDRQTKTTTLLTASSYAQDSANFFSSAPVFTGDGDTILFHSWASDIVTNDFNQRNDLFLVKILGSGGTNPPPVLTGQILFNPASGSGPGHTIPQITWAAADGVTYQVQYKTNLTDPVWLPVNGTVVIQNGFGTINDSSADPNHRFYRIVGN
jgi:Tol biopolymer transport system component